MKHINSHKEVKTSSCLSDPRTEQGASDSTHLASRTGLASGVHGRMNNPSDEQENSKESDDDPAATATEATSQANLTIVRLTE